MENNIEENNTDIKIYNNFDSMGIKPDKERIKYNIIILLWRSNNSNVRRERKAECTGVWYDEH